MLRRNGTIQIDFQFCLHVFRSYYLCPKLCLYKCIINIDILGVVLWSMGSFSKISLFLYAIVVGLAQLFHIDYYTLLTIPTATLLAIFSLITSDDLIGIY